jgi:hypothetical protein
LLSRRRLTMTRLLALKAVRNRSRARVGDEC